MTDTEELPAACETVSSPVFVTLLLQLSAAPVLNCFSLCDPMDCSPPGSSVHGIFQARVLEWGVIAFSRRPSWPTDWTRVSHIAGRRFTVWATREVLVVKKLPANARDIGDWWGRSLGKGNGNPLQYSCLENPMDRGAWWATVHGVTKSWTRLSN